MTEVKIGAARGVFSRILWHRFGGFREEISNISLSLDVNGKL